MMFPLIASRCLCDDSDVSSSVSPSESLSWVNSCTQQLHIWKWIILRRSERSCLPLFPSMARGFYSGASKFVNPLEFHVYLHKSDQKFYHIFIQVLKLDNVNSVQPKTQKTFSFYNSFIEQDYPTLNALLEKVCEPLLSVPGMTSLSSNNLNQMFSVTVNQSHTSAWRNFGPFLPTKLLQLMDVGGLPCMNWSLQVFPQHFYWTRPFQNITFLLL